MNTESDLIETMLKDIESSKAKLFHESDEAYIALNGDGSKIAKINSKDFKQWLHKTAWQKYKTPLSSDSTNKLIQTLSGVARYDSEEIKLHLRHAWDNGSLLYDCGENQPTILISASGWTLMKKTPILFRRLPHQKNQVWPVKDNHVETLTKYVNLSGEQNQLLFLVYTVAAFIPGFPHPLLVMHGPQGAGKSTPMRVLKELIDPSVIQVLPAPRKPEEFAQLAHHHAFLMFDNLSDMPGWLSDTLARISTGDGFSKRKLFTDDDDVFYILQRPIAINGINQIVSKPDLLDRSILLKLKRITQDKRMAERVFWQRFEEDRPKILGSIFETLSKALKIYDEIKLSKAPRMADFAKWGCAISVAMGFTQDQFLDAYAANISIQNEEAIEASPVAQSVLALMEELEEWEGTAAELLVQLNKKAFMLQLDKSYLWPKGPVWLTRRINEVQPNLSVMGVLIEHTATSRGRITKISKELKSTENTVNTDDDKNDGMTVKAVKNEQQNLV